MPDIDAYLPAARAALAAFGMPSARLKPISKTENAVFRVTDDAGAAFALRLHRPGYNPRAALDSERALTAALAERGMIVPTGKRAANGDWYVPVKTPDPEGWRDAGMTIWHAGETLQSRIGDDRGPATWPWFERAGPLLAGLHNNTADWTPPSGFIRHRLDADGLVGETPFWGRFWEVQSLTTEEKRLLTEARALVRVRLTELTAPFSLIHADAHAGNILIAKDNFGLIDFDDCAWGWHAFDMAVTLRSARREPGFEGLRDRFLAGYEARRALPADILQQLDLFLLVRALMLVSWCEMRPDVAGEDWKPDLLEDIRQAMAAVA